MEQAIWGWGYAEMGSESKCLCIAWLQRRSLARRHLQIMRSITKVATRQTIVSKIWNGLLILKMGDMPLGS